MGLFVNPDNTAFQVALNSEIYVDKTGLIEYTNSVVNTLQGYICNSRPRRFGKSVTANMLTAYYSKGCDSSALFDNLAISSSKDYKKYMNKFDVIHFDVQWFIEPDGNVENVVSYMQKVILKELINEYSDVIDKNVKGLPDAMSMITEKTGNRFVVIIDEWDVLIRDSAMNQKVQDDYIGLLRRMFKGTEPTKYIALAYLTGILPVKRFRTQSSMNNFMQFTMLNPGSMASYIGFTEDEVVGLCNKYNIQYDEVKRWYDGYLLNNQHIYNPNAVVSLILQGVFTSYWSQTGTYESIIPLINKDFDGLKTAILDMLSGNEEKVRVMSFQNDMVSFKNKDDVITLLIHLGYLAYNQERQTAYIPNEEIRGEFVSAVEENKWSELIQFENDSDKLLEATLDKDEDTVAEYIEKIHMEYTSAIQYNDENSLSSVLSIAYLSAMKYYFKPIRELPTGRGFADFVFIPKTMYANDYPVLVVELKWNKNVKAAIQQIKDKQYPESLRQYSGEIIMVGINYDKKSKKHECIIEDCTRL